jgi:hypothetical protein
MDYEKTVKYSSYIIKYVSLEMDPLDRQSFEEELEKNLILKEKYDLYLRDLKLKNIEALRQRFKEIDIELDKEPDAD